MTGGIETTELFSLSKKKSKNSKKLLQITKEKR